MRDDCSVWAHTDCLTKSSGRDTVACQCVCDTVAYKKNCLLTEILWGAIMFKMGNFWRCYQTFLEVEPRKYKLGRQSVLEILYTVEITCKYWV